MDKSSSLKEIMQAIRFWRIAFFLFLALLLCLLVFIAGPRGGMWGVDAGTKTLAAATIAEQGLAYSLPVKAWFLSGDRGAEDVFAPYSEPFVIKEKNRRIAVYSPLYLALCGLSYSIVPSVEIIRLLSILGVLLTAIAATLVLRLLLTSVRIKDDYYHVSSEFLLAVILVFTTPLLFYAAAIWEHSLFTACATMALFLRLKPLIGQGNGSAAGVTVALLTAGFLAALGMAFRSEGILWTAMLLALDVKRLPFFLLGGGVGLASIALVKIGMYRAGWESLVLFPHLSENFAWAEFSISERFSAVVSQLGLGDLPGPSVLYLLIPGVFFFFSFRGPDKYQSWSRWALAVFLLFVAGYRLFVPVPLGETASASGWLASAPFALAWYFMPMKDGLLRRLQILVGLFTFAAIISNPAAVGIHFGPRFLLAGIAVGSIGAVISYWQGDTSTRRFLMLLVISGMITQGWGISRQWQVRKQNLQMRNTVATAAEAAPVVLWGYYFAEDIGPGLLDGAFVKIPEMRDGNDLVALHALAQKISQASGDKLWVWSGMAQPHLSEVEAFFPLRVAASIEDSAGSSEHWERIRLDAYGEAIAGERFSLQCYQIQRVLPEPDQIPDLSASGVRWTSSGLIAKRGTGD